MPARPNRGRRAGGRPLGRRLVVTSLVCWFLLGASALAAGWTIALHSGSTSEARSSTAPAAPTGVTSACVSGTSTTVKVTWSAVTHASTYTVSESTTSATSGYSVVAPGLATASWTSAALASGSYWFEVTATVGSSWISASSSATAKRTISGGRCT